MPTVRPCGAGGDVRGHDLAGDGKEQGDRVLRRGDRVCSRSIEDEHPRPGGGVQIDIVDTDPGASDDTQVPPGGENLFRHLRLAADDERVGVAYGAE